MGDRHAGEWEEWTGRAYHVRCRLTAAEAEPIGPVVDIRGTWEATKRVNRVARYLPAGWQESDVGEVSA